MKYALLNIKRISAPVVLLASVLAFCGCISDSESPCDVENVREVTMNFRLAIQREKDACRYRRSRAGNSGRKCCRPSIAQVTASHSRRRYFARY